MRCSASTSIVNRNKTYFYQTRGWGGVGELYLFIGRQIPNFEKVPDPLSDRQAEPR